MIDTFAAAVQGIAAPAVAAWGIDGLREGVWLPALLVAAAIAAVLAWRRPRTGLRWSGLTEARDAGGRALEVVPFLAFGLRALALLGLAVAIVGPYRERVEAPATGRGLDLVLALDTSTSMRALDTVSSEARPRTRLDLARDVVARFADTRIAEGDRVGLVVFGSSAFTQCPLTHDGGLLEAALERTQVGIAGDATALGDALALAVERVARRAPSEGGRVVVLLTDGRSNAGRVPIAVAKALAIDAAVRVHTVAIGTGGAAVPMPSKSGAVHYERHDPDPATLRAIADATGGRFFAASRPADLERVYAEIDALERSDRPLPPRRRTEPSPEPLLAVASGALLAEIGLARMLRRRLS